LRPIASAALAAVDRLTCGSAAEKTDDEPLAEECLDRWDAILRQRVEDAERELELYFAGS
jgi:hypothetical protein